MCDKIVQKHTFPHLSRLGRGHLCAHLCAVRLGTRCAKQCAIGLGVGCSNWCAILLQLLIMQTYGLIKVDEHHQDLLVVLLCSDFLVHLGPPHGRNSPQREPRKTPTLNASGHLGFCSSFS